MTKVSTQKKRLVVSFHNLPVELQEELKRRHPLGFTDSMIRIDKPSGDFFYGVVFETDEVSYLVKIDVKVDGQIDEEEEKDFYDDEIKGADELIDNEAEEDEESM